MLDAQDMSQRAALAIMRRTSMREALPPESVTDFVAVRAPLLCSRRTRANVFEISVLKLGM